VGDPYKNLVLSTDRAFEVFGYLQEKGVSHRRMSFKGYGDTVPVHPNDSEAQRALNRRTEFKIVKK
jgi:outer membrane protein OmpA-like peptidoglycan-associated protein